MASSEGALQSEIGWCDLGVAGEAKAFVLVAVMALGLVSGGLQLTGALAQCVRWSAALARGSAKAVTAEGLGRKPQSGKLKQLKGSAGI